MTALGMASVAMHPAEKQAQAVVSLRSAVVHHVRPGMTVHQLQTDNGAAFSSRELRATCTELSIKNSFNQPYRPRTNGKAERFVQYALRGPMVRPIRTQPVEPMPGKPATPLQLALSAHRDRRDRQNRAYVLTQLFKQ